MNEVDKFRYLFRASHRHQLNTGHSKNLLFLKSSKLGLCFVLQRGEVIFFLGSVES